MNCLVLPKYCRRAPSSRLRMFQYFPALEQAGFHLRSFPLWGDEYLEQLNRGSHPAWTKALSAYRRRSSIIRRPELFHLTWLEYEYYPWLPDWLEPLSPQQTSRLVVEYDDAVFHRYDHHPAFWVRWLLGKKIDRIMSRARLVIAGNKYLAERAARAGAARVEIIPTVVDLKKYTPRPRPAAEDFRIGWIGSASTEKYLDMVKEPLGSLLSARKCRFVLIGARNLGWDLPGIEFHPWTEEQETALLSQLDVGIMPLPDDLWARGKCGYKLIQYMAAGLPVVASPVGVNQSLADGSNGFLARTDTEWVQAFMALRENPDLRRRMGEAGRKKVEQEYCLQVTAPRLVRLFHEIAAREIRE